MPGARYPGLPTWNLRPYPTTRVEKLIPQMPFEIPDKPVKVRGGPVHLRGHWTRLEEIAKTLTLLFKRERIEITYHRGYEVRQYAERLIVEAMRNGDCHRPTMEAANFYLNEKNLIHKLFKVFVPRYINYTGAFTSMHFLPLDAKGTANNITPYYNPTKQKVVIELKDNPLPPLTNQRIDSSNFLSNILIRAAKEDFERRKSKYENNKIEDKIIDQK